MYMRGSLIKGETEGAELRGERKDTVFLNEEFLKNFDKDEMTMEDLVEIFSGYIDIFNSEKYVITTFRNYMYAFAVMYFTDKEDSNSGEEESEEEK